MKLIFWEVLCKSDPHVIESHVIFRIFLDFAILGDIKRQRSYEQFVGSRVILALNFTV